MVERIETQKRPLRVRRHPRGTCYICRVPYPAGNAENVIVTVGSDIGVLLCSECRAKLVVALLRPEPDEL